MGAAVGVGADMRSPDQCGIQRDNDYPAFIQTHEVAKHRGRKPFASTHECGSHAWTTFECERCEH